MAASEQVTKTKKEVKKMAPTAGLSGEYAPAPVRNSDWWVEEG